MYLRCWLQYSGLQTEIADKMLSRLTFTKVWDVAHRWIVSPCVVGHGSSLGVFGYKLESFWKNAADQNARCLLKSHAGSETHYIGLCGPQNSPQKHPKATSGFWRQLYLFSTSEAHRGQKSGLSALHDSEEAFVGTQ